MTKAYEAAGATHVGMGRAHAHRLADAPRTYGVEAQFRFGN